MLDSQETSRTSAGSVADQNLAAPAFSALVAIIEAGGEILIAQPWRVARIIRKADVMTIDEVASHVARRRRAGPLADLNTAIALAQLSHALKSPRFRAAWVDWRNGVSGERARRSDAALCE